MNADVPQPETKGMWGNKILIDENAKYHGSVSTILVLYIVRNFVSDIRRETATLNSLYFSSKRFQLLSHFDDTV